MLHFLLIGGGLAFVGIRSVRTYLRQKQTAVVAQETPSFEVRDQENNRYLAISGASVGVALVGEMVFPPLIAVSIPLTLYTSLPIFEDAFDNLVQKRKLRASVIDSVALIGTLVTHYYVASAFASMIFYSGRKLLLKTEDNSKRHLFNIFGEQPRSVWLLKDGVELEIPFAELMKDDVIVINGGGVVPVDGDIVYGSAAVDQHMLTGESQPVEKNIGDPVLAGTLVLAGRIQVRVERAGQDTVAAHIGDILQNTATFTSSVESKSIALADNLVWPTLGMSTLTFIALRNPVSAIAVLSCNFSEVVRIVLPLGVLNHLHHASQQGVLIKDGRSLELLNSIDTVVFDKTGTLTQEQPHLGAIHVWNDLDENGLLRLAAAAEQRQTHPLAHAILQAAYTRGLSIPVMEDARYEMGYGLKVQIDGKIVRVGSARFMALEKLSLPKAAHAVQTSCHDNGNTLVFVAIDDDIAGALELHTTLRPEAAQIIKALKKRGLKLYIISGDHLAPTRALAATLGIDNYFADTLPEDKAKHIEYLQAQGHSVCFIGDGINDTIAMKKAQVSISLSGATTAATDTAGIVLLDKNLTQLDYLFNLTADFTTNMQRGLVLTLIPGVLGISGIFLFHFGIYSTLVLYIAALSTGVVNATWPKVSGKLISLKADAS
jgi:heavy metal translocating P-type ATPase